MEKTIRLIIVTAEYFILPTIQSLRHAGSDLTCLQNIIQPRRPAYEQGAYLHGQTLLIIGRDAAVERCRNILGRLRGWPKPSPDFALRGARFTDIAEGLIRTAADDPFRPASQEPSYYAAAGVASRAMVSR